MIQLNQTSIYFFFFLPSQLYIEISTSSKELFQEYQATLVCPISLDHFHKVSLYIEIDSKE